MSYGIMPYSVSLAEVERVFGCGDPALLARLMVEFKDDLDNDECDEDDEEEPTLAEALREIIEGEPMRPSYGHKYGYLLEMLCRQYGESLANSEFSSMHSDWIDKVDQGLAHAGIPEETLSLSRHLLYRGSPVAIPEPGDFPFIGYLKSNEIPPALQALETADLTVLEREVKESIDQLRSWLESSQKSQRDLVCFYY